RRLRRGRPGRRRVRAGRRGAPVRRRHRGLRRRRHLRPGRVLTAVTFPADPDTVDRLGALRAPMWRALAVFRFAALSYAAALVVWRSGRYEHPAAGWAVLAGMVVWTVLVTYRYARPPQWNRWPVLWADLVVTVVFVLASRYIVGSEQFADGLTIV